MMKRLTIFILLIAVALSFVSAEQFTIGKKGNDYTNDYIIDFSIVPFTGSTGINMRDERYPQYDVNSSSGLSWTGGGLDNLGRNNTSYYVNDNMIAAIAIYGIRRWYNVDSTRSVHYTLDYGNDPIKIKVTANCSSNFSFVSQSNPSITRPFSLFCYPMYAVSGYSGNHKAIQSGKIISFTPPNDNTYSLELDSDADLSYYYDFWDANYDVDLNIWFDIIGSLPLDENGVSQQGVMVGSKLYPLVDADDYSALVSFTVDLTLRYKNDNDSSDIKTMTFSKTLPVPFSGYSSAVSSVTPSKAAIYINTTTANINLNRAYTSRWVDIGNITYEQYLGTAGSSAPSHSDEKSRIFFSASSDPTVQNSNGFRFIHKNAGNVLTSNNSVPFILRFTGTGNSLSVGSVEFDGKGYTSSSSMMDGIVGESILSTCINTETIKHSQGYFHFHTIDGDLSIMVEDNSDTMQAGTYYADIYVHIITEE